MSASSKKKLHNSQDASRLTERQKAEQKEAKKLKLYTAAFVVVLAVLVAAALGVGITQVSGCLQGAGFPAWVNTVFGSSSVVVAAIMAILLNLTLPKANKQ